MMTSGCGVPSSRKGVPNRAASCAHVGQRGLLLQRLFDLGPAREIAPCDAHHFALPHLAQHSCELAIRRIARHPSQLALEHGRIQRRVQATCGHEVSQKARLTQAQLRHEIAACPHAGERCLDLLIDEQLGPHLRIALLGRRE